MTLTKRALTRVDECTWEIPADHRSDMRVPVRIFADDRVLEDALRDASLEQAINVATLPGLVRHVVVMPDVHQGYGFPIGGVAASDARNGVVSPGGIGYDINCGVRLLAAHVTHDEIRDHVDALATALDTHCPSGVGSRSQIALDAAELEAVLTGGARWALSRDFARREDLERTEEYGRIAGADPAIPSRRALERGRPQLGTLGAGNHFIEVDVVGAIADAEAAAALGLFENQIVVQIHCGSRGLGHQICTDFVSRLQDAERKYGIRLPDRELVCAPLDSSDGRDYLAAMACAANFAFANRQVLAHGVRQAFAQALGGHVRDVDLHQIYDIAHNMGKMEDHVLDGRRVRVCVHRKGATRAFGPGSEVLPADLRAIGQPVLVPGSMGTASWVLTGTARAMEQSFGSTCHGAGRLMSRAAAKRQIRGETLLDELRRRGIVVRAGSLAGLAEEAPRAYKDVDRVVGVVVRAGIARKVARLEPVAVVKG